jgi:hypothetical protein
MASALVRINIVINVPNGIEIFCAAAPSEISGDGGVR